VHQLRGIGVGEESVRGTNVEAADDGATLDNSHGYPQMKKMVHKYYVSLAGAARAD
jgi:hypothetical protein